MEIVEFERMTAERRAQLEGDEEDPFEMAGTTTLEYRRKDRHVALSDERGHLVASTGIVLTDVEVAGERFPVVGLGGVIVNGDHRGRGLGREVVEAALARARRLGPSFAILFCLEDRVGLYLRLGFREIDSTVLVAQPNGYAEMPLRTMWRALRESAGWPGGQVTVHGLPF